MTDAELAILGLVVEQPRHGYEIEQVIEERGMREWTEVGFSSIYYLLKKLEREGLVEGRLEEAERGPARKVFCATPDGVEALRAGTLDALSVPKRCYSPLLLGLSHLPTVPPAEAQTALQKYRAALVHRLKNVQEGWDRQRPLPYFVDAMFDHSVTMVQTELRWVDEFLKRMEAEHVQG
jgi:DNA-binding PadR family transcriptional regulator